MYSISTNCLPSEPLAAALDKLVPHTEHVEIMSDGQHLLTDTSLLESYNFHYSIHAPSRGVNLASVLEPIRRASVEVIADTFALAAEVDAPVVIHPGYFAWEYEYDLAKQHLYTSLTQICAESLQYGVTYFIENMGNWGYFFLKEPKDMPFLGSAPLCLDVGHANECDSLNQFLSFPFAHVHLHDNSGKYGIHASIGRGNIDFDAVMKRVRENNIQTPVIEVKSFDGALETLAILIRRYGV
ncbi:MAG: sugar phosphate isomerase/epimerase [Methanocalculaceae archaeon]|nr:sugar phosphate isomerase/epimerase [Methanocalculaceae archaeon]